MRRGLLSILLALLLTVGKSQVVGFEYFIDSDPGVGNGIPLELEPGSSVEGSYNIPLNTFGQGFHRIGLRSHDIHGAYSQTLIHSFFISPSSSSELAEVEYYVDSDPGQGNGVKIPLQMDSDGSIRYIIPLSEVSVGGHLLGIRTKNSLGFWSQTQLHFFYNRGDGELANIIRFEYYFTGDGAGDTVFSHIVEEPSSYVELDFVANVSELVPDREYEMHIYAVSDDGRRSLVAINRVNICSDEPPSANFSYVINDELVDLTNLSNNYNEIKWFLEEEVFSTGETASFAYGDPGIFEVGLIASNYCTADTLYQYITVPGIEKIYPTVGTIQQKEATITITGFGFDSIPSLRLYDESGKTILPTQVIKADSLNLRAVFNLSEVEVSKYNLQVIVNEGQDTLSSSQVFTVLEAGNIPFDEWVPFEIAAGEEFVGDVLAPEAENLFVFMKKGDRIGYDGTWYGEARLRLGEETLASWSKAEDFGFRIKDPLSTVYSIDIHNDRNYAVSGLVKVSYAPEWLKLNEWQKGEILRPYGYDWKYFDIGDNVDSLYFKTEGYGLWSTIEVFYQDMEEPEERWTFSNMGAGYAIQGNIPNPKEGRYYIRYKDSAVLQNTENDDQKREYLVYVGTSISSKLPFQEKSINELSLYEPGPGVNEIKLRGRGFNSGDSIVIQNQKEATYHGINSHYVNSSEINVIHDFSVFDQGEYKLGIWGDSILFHPKTIQIADLVSGHLQAEIISRNLFRVGRFQKFVVRVRNGGNTSKSLLSLYVSGIPVEAQVRIDSEINSIDSTYPLDSLDVYEIVDDEKIIPLLINNLPAGEYIDIEISIYLSTMKDFELAVSVDDLFDEKMEYLIESDLAEYISEIYEVDSLITVIQELSNQAARSKRENVITEELKDTYSHLFQKINNLSGAPISNDCSKELGRTFGAFIGIYAQENKNIIKSAMEFLFDDWADCLSKSASTIKGNIWDPISKNRGNGFWNTTKKVFLQSDLYSNILHSTLNCANALLTTPITPTGFATKLAAKGIAKVSTNALYRITVKRKIMNERIQKNLFQISLAKSAMDEIERVKTGFDALREGRDLGFSTGIGCQQDIVGAFKKIGIIGSVTPEDKYGPTGFDQGSDLALENRKRFVPEGQLFEYKIDYWNKEDATAPAAEVFIRDTLHTNFDISTFNFTEIGFLRWKLPLEGGKYFNVTVDMRPEKNLLVNVEGTLDMENRVVFWTHRSLDPETMELPEDPMAGYLPPIDSTGYNIGWVSFTIAPVDSLGHNVMFQNQAHVNFDGVGPWGPAPPYGPYTNTIDLSAPASYVKTLPATVDPEFEVQWGGSDDGAGIQYYDVYVSKNDGEFELWLTSTSDSLSTFQGETGNSYAFYSIAIDYAGNKEAGKTKSEATTKVLIRTLEIQDITTTSPICTGADNGSVTINTSSTNVQLEYSLDNTTFQDKNSFEDLAPGNYTAYVRDKADQENAVQKAFTIDPAAHELPDTPTISIQGEDGRTQELLLLSSSATGNQWYKDGAIVEGATAQSIEASEAGTYHVVVTGAGGCSAASEMVTITALPEVNNLHLTLYPNPADTYTTIKLGREVYVDKVTVYSALGIVLKETDDPRTATEIRLDLRGLVPGIYFVQVEGIGFVERLNLIIR